MSTRYDNDFDYEHRLAAKRYQRAPAMTRFCSELAFGWRLIANEGDSIVCPLAMEDIEPEPNLALSEQLPTVRYVEDNQVTHAQERLIQWGHAYSPDGGTDIVPHLIANHRSRSDHVEGSADISDEESLAHALANLPSGCDRWVLKAPLGMSGRERIPGQGRIVTEEVRNWMRKRHCDWLASLDLMTFRLEPWLEKVCEVSWHLTITDAESFRFDGVTRLVTDSRGQHVGNSVNTTRDTALSEMFDGQVAAEAVRNVHPYIGLLSIDAMLYRRSDGTEVWRMQQDVNARWTMGRWALAAANRFSVPEQTTVLRIFRQQEGWTDRILESAPNSVSLLSLIPRRLGRHNCRTGLVCLTADDPEAIRFTEDLLT